MSPNGEPNSRRDTELAALLTDLAIAAGAVSVEVYVRRDFGSRYHGL
jgi:hypothetical protein